MQEVCFSCTKRGEHAYLLSKLCSYNKQTENQTFVFCVSYRWKKETACY